MLAPHSTSNQLQQGRVINGEGLPVSALGLVFRLQAMHFWIKVEGGSGRRIRGRAGAAIVSKLWYNFFVIDYRDYGSSSFCGCGLTLQVRKGCCK